MKSRLTLKVEKAGFVSTARLPSSGVVILSGTIQPEPSSSTHFWAWPAKNQSALASPVRLNVTESNCTAASAWHAAGHTSATENPEVLRGSPTAASSAPHPRVAARCRQEAAASTNIAQPGAVHPRGPPRAAPGRRHSESIPYKNRLQGPCPQQQNRATAARSIPPRNRSRARTATCLCVRCFRGEY